ncbi:hypothetical protein EDEG_03045 [Edhazardia aedis USNM 41457]|uniref:Uncharacterized protein n=1 Tax=Edhazardia aedis (strain USNM 41457) TaxID=1003232 RepID=J8ZS66_EDHAE|nr:hypothetical protein EDEG_03045 [Edhazardia aedis USNM 41457]|eukprot:EJW02533.1 hypothetical protein EDEG_03045 [Edhazardia aedis USNM 41457]
MHSGSDDFYSEASKERSEKISNSTVDSNCANSSSSRVQKSLFKHCLNCDPDIHKYIQYPAESFDLRYMNPTVGSHIKMLQTREYIAADFMTARRNFVKSEAFNKVYDKLISNSNDTEER